MSRPAKTGSFLSPVWFRTDRSREAVLRYLAGLHAQIAGQLPTMAGYVQRTFSPTDHGYWPESPTVGTIVRPIWR